MAASVGFDNVVLSAVTKMALKIGVADKVGGNKISIKLTRFNIELIHADITLKAFALLEAYTLSEGWTLSDIPVAARAILPGCTQQCGF